MLCVRDGRHFAVRLAVHVYRSFLSSRRNRIIMSDRNKRKPKQGGKNVNIETKRSNRQFALLTAIAMVLVIMGHVNEQLLTFGGLFPYYSFHIALFLFISGYFYKEDQEEKIPSYIVKKAKHLLIPYFIWNLFYGIVVIGLRACGFYIGNEPSLWTLLAEPFLSGHQFSYNAPAWFVPALFLAQAANVVIRRILRFVKIQNEWIIQGIYLCMGFAVVWLSANGYVYDWYRIPGRIMYMLPCFQMGKLYRAKLEEKDRLPNWLYFGILFAVQLFLVANCNGLAVSAAWCNGFLNGPVIPYLTAVTGIAFWLRTAKILLPVFEKSRFWNYLGDNTYAVMMHQLPAMMLVSGIFAAANRMLGAFGDFSWDHFLTDVYYVYLPGGQEAFRWIYVIAAICLPLTLQKGIDLTKEKTQKRS